MDCSSFREGTDSMVGPPQFQPEASELFPPRKKLEAEIPSPLEFDSIRYRPADKLKGKIALVTGGDSGIGRAVAVIYAREGANVAITFLPQERSDAKETYQAIARLGRNCLLLEGDLTDEKFCKSAVSQTVKKFGKLDILVKADKSQRYCGSADSSFLTGTILAQSRGFSIH